MPEISLKIVGQDVIYWPLVEDDIILKHEKGGPSSLTFTVVKDGVNSVFEEGAAVLMYVDHIPTFKGFVFTKKTNRDKHITVKAYDQMRYLKNKFTYLFEDKRADEIIKMIAEDQRLNVSPELPSTSYMLPSLTCQNKTLIDIINEALTQTYDETKVDWILFDDFGMLTLGNPDSMFTNILITGSTAEDFDYETTIDEDTYNDVFLVKQNSAGIVENFVHYDDPDNIAKWGLLRYFEDVSDETLTLETRGQALFEVYNQKKRRLTIKRAFGNVRMRPGCLVNCSLDLGDLILKKTMMISSATHNISYDHYTVDLTVEGGTIEGGQFVA